MNNNLTAFREKTARCQFTWHDLTAQIECKPFRMIRSRLSGNNKLRKHRHSMKDRYH